MTRPRERPSVKQFVVAQRTRFEGVCCGALRQLAVVRTRGTLDRDFEIAAVQGAAPKRHGYTAAHRRTDGASGMNSDLSDAEWALVFYRPRVARTWGVSNNSA